ncbi:hypothetical protein CDL12_22982 [Handroanthus impetiginosus]|uniref:Uncharacterized protein n=1 Tax=Handroanthus impetiginosus TaxID=429701 RepID=A0A2G9GH08_9LAMI|nr:hypothetical protein CDL12_22982 [Handroanthus impetiginosus]
MPQDKAIFSREKSIKNFNKKGMFQDSPSEAPTTMCTSAKIKLRRDHEADRMAGAETYVYKDIQSELGEADEGGRLEDQMSTKDEDLLLGVSNLFDAERSAPSTPQGGSSLHEISPSMPNSVSASTGIVYTISKTCEIIHKKAGATDSVQGREGAIFQSNGKNKLFNLADGHTNKDTYEPVERPKSPIADSIQGQDPWSNESETTRHAMAMLKTNGKGKSSQVAQGSNTDGDASDPNCGKDKGDMVDASITDVSTSMYYTISKIGAENLKELKFQDIKETEHECESPLAGQAVSDAGEESSDISSRSWTEFELNTLFGTTADSVTPTRLNDTSCQGTEIATLTISVNNSFTSNTSSLTKKKKKTVLERGSEDAKTMSKNVVLQPDYEEASNNGFSLGSEENQLKLLFATPIKIVTPCKVDETSAHEEKLDNAAMFKECVRRMKENVVTQIKSDEKVGDSGNEFEYSLPIRNSLPRNGEDVTSKELHQAEGVELVNKCTTPVLSGSEYDGCEVSKQQLTENTCECMRETNFITEENKEEKIISLGQSRHCGEATDNHTKVTDRDIFSSSGALKNLDKVEGCTDLLIDSDLSENLSCRNRSYLKSEEELAQSSEAAVELSDAGFQNSDIQENGHPGYVDGNILRETSFDNFRGAMDAKVANVGSFDGGNFVIEKGTSPSLFSKASYDDGEVAKRKDANSITVDDDPYHDISHTREETDSLSLSHDISEELHPNSKVSILKILSVSFTPSQEAHKLQSTIELQSTNLTGITTQNADTVVPAAEHGSSLCSGESDILSSMAMHRLLGDNENGDIEKSEARGPLFNLEYDVEKVGKEVAENSTEAIAQFSISKLQLEEKFVDSNNDIHTISDASASIYNEILKESDVADTIQEYIDSESSLSMDFDGSGASHPINVLAHIDEKSTCKNGVVCESAQAIGDKPTVGSLKTESNLEESTLFMKPAPVSEEAVKSSPAPIDLLVESSTANKPSVEEKGAAITEAFLMSKEIETSSKQLYSTPKKNARTILIHGTPRKLLTTVDMKENTPLHKNSNIGDFTTVRPAKRKALQDVQWR